MSDLTAIDFSSTSESGAAKGPESPTAPGPIALLVPLI